MLPDYDGVRRWFEYNPETGELYKRYKRDWNNVELGQLARVTNMHNEYLTTSYKGKTWAAHRIIWLWYHGYWPEKTIDHINRVRYDNRISNLREVSHSENSTNRKTRITRDDAIFIRENKLRAKEVVERYKISYSYAYKIIEGRLLA